MKKIPNFYEAEIRSHRSFRWLMKTEPSEVGNNPRWETFRKLRDRLLPYRMPLIQRLTLALVALSGGKYEDMVDPEMQTAITKSLTS